MNLPTIRDIFSILGPITGIAVIVVFNVLLFRTEISMLNIIFICGAISLIGIISMINSDRIYGIFLRWNTGTILKIGVVIGIIIDFILKVQTRKEEKQIERFEDIEKEDRAKRQNDWLKKLGKS